MGGEVPWPLPPYGCEPMAEMSKRYLVLGTGPRGWPSRTSSNLPVSKLLGVVDGPVGLIVDDVLHDICSADDPHQFPSIQDGNSPEFLSHQHIADVKEVVVDVEADDIRRHEVAGHQDCTVRGEERSEYVLFGDNP